jgi:hypothetical protein
MQTKATNLGTQLSAAQAEIALLHSNKEKLMQEKEVAHADKTEALRSVGTAI